LILHYSFPTLKNPFWQEVVAGMEERARALGLRVDAASAEDDDDRQAAHLEGLVSKRDDVVAVSPTRMARMLPILAKLMASQVRVVAVDHNLGEKGAASVISANTAGGVALANYAIKTLGVSGRIVHVQAEADMQSAVMRRNSFTTTIKRHGLEIVAIVEGAGTRQVARAQMLDFLGKKPDFNAIYAENDVMALGAVDALQQLGVEPWPAVLSFDGIAEAIDRVRDGKIAATIVQRPREIGQTACSVAHKISRGAPFDKLTTIGTRLVSRATLSQVRPVP
jgi:ribose transport system substrate-binding protein